MNTSSEVRDVINFLKQRFITISPEWVEACISFVKQEYAGRNLQMDVLKNDVYQQWLTADLEEIGVSALSNELPTFQKFTLRESFALQMNSVRDVGRPAYVQLKELDRSASSNAEFTSAPPPTLAPWESKPTRMLMLNLTDGCTTVQGMEYKPINFLSLSLPPGVKVLIKGPVDCRFGVLLLTPEKISVLGGEVESKLVQFSQKAILRETLNIPIPEEPESTDDPLIINGTEQALNDFDEAESASIISGNHYVQQNASSFAGRHQNDNFVRPSTSRAPQNVHQNSFPVNRENAQAINRQQSGYNPRFQAGGQIADDLESFEDEDDDFVRSLDYAAIDELEKESNLTQTESFDEIINTEDIWQEDEDVLQDLMAFQDEDPVFEMPAEVLNTDESMRHTDNKRNVPFSYLSSVLENLSSECLITVKGFIIKVLSKLECTADNGWSLCVKINDGTATLDANIHDKVLEGIIGVSAIKMVKKQKEAAQDPVKRKEVIEAISKCKVTLQDYNCLMDVKLSPGLKPCVMKCHPVTQLHIKQLLERTRSYF